ncbi:YceI family protein [Pseudogemmobacter faecipullorum]|uniref:Polyisoprenoid-binding protein n=1 Tax=Pseudogemmobacter faecipullorum TaxID=2755041 RepID=A0ABS8CKT1_9RHOB|nr:YceI family protein [Pseudogemmobacter faecipullorum]MCB5409998.1 polyisoprenoid-binding protein [Pseudogemmobacter faecipullorum]
MNRPLSLVTAAFALLAAPAFAEPVTYKFDAGHSEAQFSYNHLGFSTNHGIFSEMDGTIVFDAENPAASSVEVSFPVSSLLTGAKGRTEHFLTADFFNAATNPTVTFKSTAIEVTGEKTAKITGDLTLNGVTKSVVLDTTLNQAGEHPMEKKEWLGLSATTTLVRTEFNLGQFAPFVSDEVAVVLNVEAGKAD